MPEQMQANEAVSSKESVAASLTFEGATQFIKEADEENFALLAGLMKEEEEKRRREQNEKN